MLRLKHPRLVHLRAASGLFGNICIIYAFVTIPLAEAYSLAFLAPIFIMLLSVFLLREKVSWQRMALLGVSFLGVLLVVRPGFRELHPGHLAAAAAALCSAITTTVLRRVAVHESRVSLIGLALGYIIIVNGIWMIPDFRVPSLDEILLLLVIGGLGGTANIIFIAATRRAPASEIAPSQYSQIAWAILLGAAFYHEYPDGIAYAGLALVVGTGILNVISDDTRVRVFARLSGFGPATATARMLPPVGAPDPADEAIVADRTGADRVPAVPVEPLAAALDIEPLGSDPSAPSPALGTGRPERFG
jgi:drug/metabolite transporter (DMT)-like permease